MNVYQPIVKYKSFNNSIVFPERIAIGLLPDFSAAIQIWNERKRKNELWLDFSAVQKAYANGMLGIIASVNELRRQGITIKIRQPQLVNARNFFSATSWTNLLDPALKDGYRKNNKHFVKQFDGFDQVPSVINHFMDIIMGHIQMPKDVLAALEWSITEICDNVINHAESKIGGFLQVIAYPESDLVAFTVADAGKGILQSLKEGFPNLSTDVEAIQEAIKAGVTRNKDAGQGNGLAGTSRITIMTGGSLDILTGSGRLLLQPEEQNISLRNANQRFLGTCVSGQIRMSHEFSVIQALSFGKSSYTPYTIVDAKYEKNDEDVLYIKIYEHMKGAGTRVAGKEMRNKVINLLAAKPDFSIIIDWQNVTIIASSFADEFLGKIFIDFGKVRFESLIQNLNMSEVVELIISKAITERTLQ